jgi:two-component system response regulator AtoC
MSICVALADADPSVFEALAQPLEQAGIELVSLPDDKSVILALQKRAFDVACVDIELPTMGGLRMLALLGERWPGLPVILTSSQGGVAHAVQAVDAGAADFASKPLDAGELAFAIRKVMAQVAQPEDEPPPASTALTTKIIGGSAAMREVLALVHKAASGNATVLVRGESGTGKELLARRVHESSARRSGPFVKVHSAALPEQLLESELFGYEKGAFTGANSRKPGRVELAEGGTLFLDEIGDITPATQVKLLRVLQEREFERLGGTETLRANVRFVAATHKPLEDMVQQGTFREDLYYRLNVIPITAPSLRERPEDIAELVAHFVVSVSAANDKPTAKIDAPSVALMAEYDWPGNVRQLQNFIERLIVLSDGPDIPIGVVRRELSRLRAMRASRPPAPGAVATKQVGELSLGLSVVDLDEAVRRAERKALEKALSKSNGNRTVAARILGVSRRTLYNKLAEHGLG